MKVSSLLFIFSILANVSHAQTFIGKQHEHQEGYTCSLHINNDSSVIFIYDRDANGIYAEYFGAIKKLNDSLYRVSATQEIGQFCMKSFNNDTIYIQLDPDIATQLDKIQVAYADGKTRKELQGYDRKGQPINVLKIPVDKKLFNERKGTDYITITINRKNFLTDNFLSFKIPFGSAASFTSGQKTTFDVVIKGNKLHTVAQAPLQTGHFKLEKKSRM